MTSFIKMLSIITLIAGSIAQASETADQLAGTSWAFEKECSTIHFRAKADDLDVLIVKVERVQIPNAPAGCSPMMTISGKYYLQPTEADESGGFNGLLVQESRGNVLNLGLASWLRIVTTEDGSTVIEITRSKVENGKVSILAPILLRKIR